VKIHIVQKGDTLWKIAQKYGVDFEQLKKMNGHLSNPNMIMPGMKIKVPTAGVPVKKEMPKKEAKINMVPKQEMENVEHPYANIKPFISVDIETELSPNVPSPEKEKVKESPKPSMNETPKPAVNESPKLLVNEQPKPIKKEMPKPSMNEAPKLPMNESPKPTVNESPHPPVNEPPKQLMNEPHKIPNIAPTSEKELKKQLNIPPLSHTIPPVAPNVNINFSNALSNVLPIPPKPENILPGIMKPEAEIESPAEAAEKEKAEMDNDTPPALPNIPHVPVMPQPYLTGMPLLAPLPQYPCVPVTPVLPDAGFYFPFMPSMSSSYPTYPQPLTDQMESSSSHAFPGIEESSSESGEAPPMPDHHAENVAPSTAANIAPIGYSPLPSPALAPYPMVPCTPITPVMQVHGWNPMFYSYMPPAFASYPVQPYVAGPAYPFPQASPAPAFLRGEERPFTEPQDTAGDDHNEQ
jgi:morphogenetic protein associated with SpoVID